MTTAQVVETSVTNISLSKDYPHPDDHAKQITDTTGFKSFTKANKQFNKSLPYFLNLLRCWQDSLVSLVDLDEWTAAVSERHTLELDTMDWTHRTNGKFYILLYTRYILSTSRRER